MVEATPRPEEHPINKCSSNRLRNSVTMCSSFASFGTEYNLNQAGPDESSNFLFDRLGVTLKGKRTSYVVNHLNQITRLNPLTTIWREWFGENDKK